MSDDLVTRLRDWVPLIAAGLRLHSPALLDEAADHIEKLETALQRLVQLDEFLDGEPSCVEEVMNYTQSIARAALAGEKKDE